MVVSVIIPCYNAERWIEQAVDSCLNQTYSHVEVIVVDDGSTDASWAKLQTYGSRIRAIAISHENGNVARNRGLALATGEYIQFLDADDYLLPQKIEQQVACLQTTGADVVYGDWRHQYHRQDGSSYLGSVVVSGEQPDVLEALLAGWWIAPAALLFKHQAVVQAGGWDETLLAGQDRDFFIAVAMTGADIRYQPGCFSIYRRYGNVTLSTSNRERWLTSHQRILDKAEHHLAHGGRLNERYRLALAKAYFHLARNNFDLDREQYQRLLAKTLSLAPAFRPAESIFYNTVQRFLGFAMAERLASFKRRLAERV